MSDHLQEYHETIIKAVRIAENCGRKALAKQMLVNFIKYHSAYTNMENDMKRYLKKLASFEDSLDCPQGNSGLFSKEGK